MGSSNGQVDLEEKALNSRVTNTSDTPSEWEEERLLFRKVLKTFNTYRDHARLKLKTTMRFVQSLPTRHQELLTQYKDHLRSIHTCIDVNQQLFHLILESVGNLYENHQQIYGTDNHLSEQQPLQPTPFDYDRLNSVMKQLVRDWSAEGAPERLACFRPIIDEIEQQFKHIISKEDVNILVPGCGTGRLTNEIARLGYSTQGNEFSMYMLFTSNFILNRCYGENIHTCYPWLSETVNVLHHDHQIRPIRIPDLDPTDLPPGSKFSMTAGDFMEVYASEENQGAWDCIATCFFVDCSTNIIALVERIFGCLKENGVWVNLGPLLYHYADLPHENSIEPSYDFLIDIIKKIGFKLEKETLNIPTQFSANQHSMLSYSYKSVFFVCRKTSSTEVDISSKVQNFQLRKLSEEGSKVAVEQNNGENLDLDVKM